MDKEHIRLLVWGLFGAFGFTIFLVLLFCFHHRLLKVEDRLIDFLRADNTKRYSMRNTLFSPTQQPNAIILPRILREFSFAQLDAATNKFSQDNLVKAGHSGDLYMGMLETGELVVVKRFQPNKTERDFYQAEIEDYARILDQQYLVPLLGQCLERTEEILVYQYMKNGDLASALATPRALDAPQDEKRARALPWTTRLKIALETAQALAYLHHNCSPSLVHRNIQSSSILLAENFDVKLGSLVEAQTLDGNNVPTYDIYCFGKILLDLLSGLDVSGSTNSYAETWMLKALPLIDLHQKDDFMEMIDPLLMLEDDLKKEALGIASLAKACMDPRSSQSLSMEKIHSILQNPRSIAGIYSTYTSAKHLKKNSQKS